MAKYFYNKYVEDSDTVYSNPDPSWSSPSTISGRVSAKPNYSFSTASGFSTSGTTGNDYYTFYYYKSSATNILRYYNQEGATYLQSSKGCDSDVEYSQGSLIEENIVAEDGTYPDDGRQDGYWWVKGSEVPASTSGFLIFF